MFWLAYLFTVIVGGTFAVILRVLRKVLLESDLSGRDGLEVHVQIRPKR